MRSLVLGLLGAAALTIASGASATETYTLINSTFLNSAGSAMFGANVAGQSSIADAFAFTLDLDSDANAQVSSLALRGNDIDFTSIYLDNPLNAFTQTSFDPATETWELDPMFLSAGLHTIYVNGTLGSTHNGSYVGNLNIAAVPEPATWALMLLGFGAIGWQMRRRRPLALAQSA